jgi:hypothetical protein
LPNECSFKLFQLVVTTHLFKIWHCDHTHIHCKGSSQSTSIDTNLKVMGWSFAEDIAELTWVKNIFLLDTTYFFFIDTVVTALISARSISSTTYIKWDNEGLRALIKCCWVVVTMMMITKKLC